MPRVADGLCGEAELVLYILTFVLGTVFRMA